MTPRTAFRFQNRRQGMALVVTLATLVLVTVAAMAFFVRATANRSIEVARSNNVLATEAAATAEAYTLFTLQKEIFANSSNITANGTTYYRPANATSMVPQRVPPAASFPAATFPSLVRRSVNETAGGVGETNASAHSTGTASRDGRLVTAARWNAPQLNRSPGFTTALVPNWIYISRNGTATATPPADAVGRFAYCIYDTSGLLDANHAGGGTATDLPAKGWLLNADIATSTNATIDATTLRQWRSGNLTAPELHTAWSQTGGLRPPSGGRQFSSRRDLLRALGTNSTAGLTGGIALAPDLTHFTRELHAPSLPFLNANATLGFPAAESNRFAAFYSTNNTFTGYSDNGTSFTYKLKAGAPVLHRRFSLGKLGRESGSGYQYWLTPTGPGAGISEAAIKAVFGLRWNSGQERWDYTSPDGNAPTDQIKTLAQVAAANRPPDFFEILKAGINPDSLGGRQTLNGATQLTLEEQARQGSTDLHVLRIGASMIDQADNDNYPTRLGFSLAGTDIEAAGVEDLPYLFGIALRTQYTRTRATDAQVTAAGGNSATQYGYFWDGVRVAMSPILFNPHRRGPVAASNPASLSFELLGGEVSDLGAIGAVQPPFLDLSRYTDTSLTPGSLAIPSAALAAFDSYRACPKNINNWGRLMTATISGAAVPNHLFAFMLPFGDLPPNGLVGAQPVLASKATVDAGYNASNQSIPDLPGFLKFKYAGLRIGLAYTSPSGQMRYYDTLGGAVTPGGDGIDTGWLRAGFQLNYAPTQADYTGSFTSPDNLGNTIGAFVKMLHPGSDPTREELNEYLEYAIEGRRRVKEQLNKKKDDDEFASINLGYFDQKDQLVTVWCPESKDAPATQSPMRHTASTEAPKDSEREPEKDAARKTEPEADSPEEPVISSKAKERHYRIHYGAVGYSYETIFKDYIAGAKELRIEDPYIRQHHQIVNFLRFCETVVRLAKPKKITLVTKFDDELEKDEAMSKLFNIIDSLKQYDVELIIKENSALHDREVLLSSGWSIKIGRGFDIYQRPDDWLTVGANDLDLRQCLETNVDIIPIEYK